VLAGGATAGALKTAFNKGNFAVNVFSGAITAGIVYGVGKAALSSDQTSQESLQQSKSETPGGPLQFAQNKFDTRDTLSDADPIYSGTQQSQADGASNALLGGALIKAGGAAVASGLAIGKATLQAAGMHLGHSAISGFQGIGNLILGVDHLVMGGMLRMFAVGNAFAGGYMIGSGIHYAVPWLRNGDVGHWIHDRWNPVK
jgi:hypothetical protein